MITPLNRHKNILEFALSSLLRRRAKNLSLLGLYTMVVFVLASLIFFVHSLKREAAAVLSGAPEMVIQRQIAGRHDLIPLEYIEKISAIRGVATVEPRYWGYYYDPVFGANYTVMVSEARKLTPGNIIIGNGVARTQRISAGDMVTFRSASKNPLLLNVQELLNYESELVAADLILISGEDFQAMFNLPRHQATDLAVTINNPAELATIAAKIAERYPDVRPILRNEILRTYDSLFDWRGGMMTVILFSAILSFVIFAWDKASGLSAEERREIGILKSIGWETSDVLLLKFWEGTAISLTAFLLGSNLAYVHVFFLSAPLFAPALKGWSVLYPEFRLIPAIDFFQLAVLFFLSVVPYTAATILPSWMAATVDPDAAMRS
ncbi:FtsX-like permease family protein [Geobacter pelophilus]|uniref:FtsX-like permease family protein n=1 Tax=Geoanaerobacter pelophilus TaxID=60036 RepID=A0AAW4L7G5_9BACT|nr:FtsX-like permease family protein [Geoanaerobacter pelophilus]MBT0666107.1 FtsX-like permease family protein [Geoanaerobacter pelophilus]